MKGLMEKIKEVIVVEGKDDTKQIAKAVNADTFETNGSALSSKDLSQLAKLQAARGLIVFTDPDFNGERLRKIISQAVPGVKHAFIRRDQGVPDEAHGSLGVEHADPAVIKEALAHVYTQETAPAMVIIYCHDASGRFDGWQKCPCSARAAWAAAGNRLWKCQADAKTA